MSSPYLDALRERVLVFDGATGSNLMTRNLTADDFGGESLEGCNEMLVLTRPDVVGELHASFFEVGVDIVETNTFGSFSTVLTEYDIADRAYELSRAGAQIARQVADDFAADGRPRFVAGSMGPGTKLPSLGQIRFAQLRDSYAEQAHGLLDGGVDLLLIETVYDLLQAKAAIVGARRAMQRVGRHVPIQVQVTMETTGRMLVGTEIGAALCALDAMKPDVIGLNCATGPHEMTEHLRHLSAHARMPISCLPNAGLPSVVDGHTHYDLSPAELAAAHARFISEFGVATVGGCCGTSPEHLRAVVEAVRDLPAPRRHPEHEPGLASIYSAVPYHQDASFLVVGERTNANGSKKFRDAMLAADWDTTVQMAKEQTKEGSHVLDVCVDYVGRDGTADMDEIASRLATQATVPLMLDSTEPEVLEAGLQWIGGKAILNSANLEDGDAEGSRADRVFRLAKQYGAAVVCLLIDEQGQARDVEWKMRIARRLYSLATQRYGIDPTDLMFDALTFPLSTGDDDLRRDAEATIAAIRQIKSELTGVSTVLGVSNVSFGLNPAARQVLNSVFLHECREAGLDAAIVHAARILPLHRIPERERTVCLDLIYDRRSPGYDPLTELLDLFSDATATVAEKEDRSGWSVEQRLEHRIIDGDRDGLEADLDEALQSRSALSVVNDVLLEGMRVVGELFGKGEMQLPFVLQSAECMKTAVAYLEPHMERSGGETTKGTLVLATVKGDVHDIGKNLVDIILTNNGYTVHNLGIKVPIAEMIDAAVEHKADAIGMSGLLVKSTLIMRDNLAELSDRGLNDIPVLLGGAALTRTYVERDLRKDHVGRVFYGKDAFEGLHTMDRLMALKRGEIDDPDYGRALGGRAGVPERHAKTAVDPTAAPPHAPSVATDNQIFSPPFVGSRVVKGIALNEIAEYINETALFRNQWGYRPEGGESDEAFKTRIRSVLREQLDAAQSSGVLVPAVVYGYFPCNADGNQLVVWDDTNRSGELARFTFPRQNADPWLCIADFFRPIESGEIDYAAFHVVTMGGKVSEATAQLFGADKYQDYLLLHGLAVELTEALAELWHRRVREELGFADQDGPTLTGLFRQQYRGGRYSWGYPACPDLEDNAVVASLLDAQRIGVTVGEQTSWQFEPEQSTSAIICHHPQAKYFVARG